MIAWRVAKAIYADLSGIGAKLHGGRWNSSGHAVVYMAEHPALAMLEILVHLDLPPDLVPDDYVLMRIELPDKISKTLVADFPDNEIVIGDQWIAQGRSALLEVPSVLMPHSRNVLLNVSHADASQASFTEEPLVFDPRLIKE